VLGDATFVRAPRGPGACHASGLHAGKYYGIYLPPHNRDEYPVSKQDAVCIT